MQPLPVFGRALVLFLAFAAPAALAQTSPYIDKDDATTYEEAALRPQSAPDDSPATNEAVADQAVADAMRAAQEVLAETETPEAMPDLLRELELAASAEEVEARLAALTPEQRAAAEAAGLQVVGQSTLGGETTVVLDENAASTARRNDGLDFYRRTTTPPPVQTHPVISDGYGRDGDGYPDRMAVSGTIVEAGSLRICRFDAPPVSRWLRIRLSDTTATFPGEQIIVAVQCHEDKKELLVGRRVRMEVWKSISGRPIRMATDDVPSVGTPMYESYPGNVRLGG